MAEQQAFPCQDYESFLAEPDESCKDFIMQQTMMRIKDPKRSLDFYTRVLGMRWVIAALGEQSHAHAYQLIQSCIVPLIL